MLDAIEVGYAIKDRRAELGLTQEQLARLSGVSKRCLWSLEMGQIPGVQLDKLLAVLGALGLDLSISVDEHAVPDALAKAFVGHRPASGLIGSRPDSENALAGKDVGIDALAILTGGKQ